jgi:hypothetical protein
MKIDESRLAKAAFLTLGLLITFFANEWFKQAFNQPTEIGRWVLLIVSLLILIPIIYFNLDGFSKC